MDSTVVWEECLLILNVNQRFRCGSDKRFYFTRFLDILLNCFTFHWHFVVSYNWERQSLSLTREGPIIQLLLTLTLLNLKWICFLVLGHWRLNLVVAEDIWCKSYILLSDIINLWLNIDHLCAILLTQLVALAQLLLQLLVGCFSWNMHVLRWLIYWLRQLIYDLQNICQLIHGL